MIIKNRDALEAVGDIRARKVVLEIAEAVLQRLDAHPIICGLLQLERDAIRIGDYRWHLGSKRRVFVVGAGKAANAMARAVEEVLGDRITQGLVIVKRLERRDSLRHIELIVGGHPLPNADGLFASQRILKIVDQAAPEDLFISVISGGSSALMNCPIPGISLEDERQVTEALLESGARILETNAVRRHISATNGGRLAQKIEAKGAEMINFIISDSPGHKPTVDPAKHSAFFGTPVAPDDTTFQDARDALEKYGLMSRIPRTLVEFLQKATPADETPKCFGSQVRHFVLERPADACEAAKRAAEERGMAACVLTTLLEGESSSSGTFLACVAKEVAMNRRPVAAPCLLVAGGETTTRLEGLYGQGGPSQELALGFALEVMDKRGVCLCALDTDGTDGPTEIAGGVVDGSTVERAKEKGLDSQRYLRAHDSSTVLQAVGDAVLTGNTGTNVCDLNIVYVSDEA